ncbi:MAG: helix-turn-helix domain-containing protein [Oscillospiraceae bacterium]|nr:helix-turn-helix domain-containing protein [Oscillospiraceae bacterium]
MSTIGDKILERRTALNMSQDELAQKVGYKDRSSIAKIESGERDIRQKKLIEFAKALGTTPQWLMGYEEKTNISAVYKKNIRMVPVFESVSAGFGAYADDQILDYCPFIINSEKEAAETIAIRVSGDSMSPKIEDGDIIRVHKQDSVDSGSIAVVLLDGEEGLVKKVVYGDDWIELHSINPYYPVRRFEGEEVLRLRVVGLVKGSFRDI